MADNSLSNTLISAINNMIDNIDNDISFIKTEIFSKFSDSNLIHPVYSKIMEYKDTLAKSNYKASRLDFAISMYYPPVCSTCNYYCNL